MIKQIDEWHPNISIKRAQQIYPELSNIPPFVCSCGNILNPSHVAVDGDFIGIESDECDCGDYCRQGHFVTRNNRANTKWLRLFENSEEDIQNALNDDYDDTF